MTIDEIAEERGLSEGTVMGHFEKIKTIYPEVDISKYKPEQALFRRVQIAHKQILATNDPDQVREDGSVSLKALFDSLNQEVSYAEIKLAMVFI